MDASCNNGRKTAAFEFPVDTQLKQSKLTVCYDLMSIQVTVYNNNTMNLGHVNISCVKNTWLNYSNNSNNCLLFNALFKCYRPLCLCPVRLFWSMTS